MLLHALAGFVLVPALARSWLPGRLAAVLNRPATIGAVSFNPYTLVLRVDRFEMREPDGKEVFVAWEQLTVDVEFRALLRGELHLREIGLAAPRVRLVVNRDGSLNVSDLLAGLTAGGNAAPTAALVPFQSLRLDRLQLTAAIIELQDDGPEPAFRSRLGPAGLTMTDFRTAGGSHAPYRFEAVTESGEKLSWSGWVQAAPFASGGELTLAGLVLEKYAPYYAERSSLEVQQGRLTVRGRYEIDLGENRRALRLHDGVLELRDLQVADRATGATVLELPAAEATGIAADGLNRTLAVQAIDLQAGRLRVTRGRDGTIDLVRWLVPAGTKYPLAAAGVTVAALQWNQGQIEIEDHVPISPVRLILPDVQVALQRFSLADNGEVPVTATLGWPGRGRVGLTGNFSPRTAVAELAIEADGLALPVLSPYLETAAMVRLTEGTGSFAGNAKMTPQEGRPAEFGVAGQLWLENVRLADTRLETELATFSDLVASGLQVEAGSGPNVRVDSLHLMNPRGVLVLDEGGAFNWAGLRRPKDDARAAPAAQVKISFSAGEPTMPPERRPFAIGHLVVADGAVDFADRSIGPNVRLKVDQLTGRFIRRGSAGAAGEVDLRGRIEGAPLRVTGALTPFGGEPSADLRATLEAFDLAGVRAYSAKYAGYDVANGNLTLAAQVRWDARRVAIDNRVTLDQFAFGAASNSPEATNLPLRLGVALLKDSQGRIQLDVPVQGSLDDPEFKIGWIAWKTVSGALARAAASPFAVLGALVGGGKGNGPSGGSELSTQEFAPGSAELTAANHAHLDALARALAARPALRLEIEGSADAATDGNELRIRKFAAWVRQAALDRRNREPEIPGLVRPAAGELTLTAAEYEATVKGIFDRQFPPGTALGTPLPPAPYVQPAPPKRGTGLFQRFLDVIFQTTEREQEAFQREQKRIQDEFLAAARSAVDQGLPLEVMTARLTAAQSVETEELAALAAARAAAVHAYLVERGRVAPGRLALVPPIAGGRESGARVRLNLR